MHHSKSHNTRQPQAVEEKQYFIDGQQHSRICAHIIK